MGGLGRQGDATHRQAGRADLRLCPGDETLQLSLSYRTEDGPGLRAGDRMPDGITDQGRIFDLLRGPDFVTLDLPDGPVLVRPDGYVAAIGRSAIDAYFGANPVTQLHHHRVAAGAAA